MCIIQKKKVILLNAASFQFLCLSFVKQHNFLSRLKEGYIAKTHTDEDPHTESEQWSLLLPYFLESAPTLSQYVVFSAPGWKTA